MHICMEGYLYLFGTWKDGSGSGCNVCFPVLPRPMYVCLKEWTNKVCPRMRSRARFPIGRRVPQSFGSLMPGRAAAQRRGAAPFAVAAGPEAAKKVRVRKSLVMWIVCRDACLVVYFMQMCMSVCPSVHLTILSPEHPSPINTADTVKSCSVSCKTSKIRKPVRTAAGCASCFLWAGAFLESFRRGESLYFSAAFFSWATPAALRPAAEAPAQAPVVPPPAPVEAAQRSESRCCALAGSLGRCRFVEVQGSRSGVAVSSLDRQLGVRAHRHQAAEPRAWDITIGGS